VTAVYGIGFAMALLTGGAMGLLLAVARYQHSAAQRRKYEQEIAQDAQLYAAAKAALRCYRPTGPQNSTPTKP
jgi:hypothetical protein